MNALFEMESNAKGVSLLTCCRSLSARIVSLLVLFLLLGGVAASAEQVTITFQYRGGGARTEVALAWIEEFEKLHPEIHVEFLPAPSGYRERTILSWASGTGPDITEIWGDWAQDYARAGVLMDLRPFIERDFTAEEIADFFPVAWEASYLKYGPNAGIQFRVPRYIITTAYYYNQNLFERAGLPTPDLLEAAGEWTYDTLRDVARKLTISQGDQIAQWGFTLNATDYRRLAEWVRAFGGEWFDPANPYAFVGDEGGAVEAMSFLQEMVWVDRSTEPTLFNEGFEAGVVALMEDGNHDVFARYDRNIQGAFEWNLAPVPVGPNGRKAYTGDDGFVIWKDTPHPEAAWEFVKFLVSKQGQELMSAYEGLAPVRRSAFPFYQQLGAQYRLDIMFTNMADAGPPISSFMVGDVAAVGTQINNALAASIQRNEKPYVQAVREVADAIEGLLRR